MTDPRQIDIKAVIGDLAGERKMGGTVYRRQIETLLRHYAAAALRCCGTTLLRHYAAAGTALATVADAKHLDRTIDTLKRYARDLSLSFPDYVPRALRPKKDDAR